MFLFSSVQYLALSQLPALIRLGTGPDASIELLTAAKEVLEADRGANSGREYL